MNKTLNLLSGVVALGLLGVPRKQLNFVTACGGLLALIRRRRQRMA